MAEEKKLTGYPSIDKPWLKYYSEEAIHAPLPQGTMYEYMCIHNNDRIDETALNFFGKKVAHRSLRDRVEKCAKSLAANGVKAGDFVGLCMLATPETVYLFYAINRLGAVCNFIVLNATEQDIHKQLSECRIVFTADLALEKVLQSMNGTNVQTVISIPVTASAPFYVRQLARLKGGKQSKPANVQQWSEFLNSGNSQSLPPLRSDEASLAAICYTGGTTGESKGVMLTNRAGNMIAENYLTAKTIFDFRPGLKLLDILPPFLAYGLFLGIHLSLCMGCETIMSPDPSPQTFPDKIKKYKPNCFLGGAMHIDSLMHSPKTQSLDLSFLQVTAFGGDKVTEEWEQAVQSFLKRNHAPYGVCNGYGMTEVAGAFCTSSHKLEHMIPFVKNNVKIIDVNSGKELKYGQEGEVCISGPSMMLGYYHMPEITEEVIWEENGERWLHTGDLGYVTEDGYFVISGRIKRIFMSAGADKIIYRVYPMKVESVLSQCSQVHQCCVVGKPDHNKGYVPIAFVVLHEGGDRASAVSEMKALCMKELAESSRPTDYQIVDSLPMTGAGKIDYRALEKQAEEMQQS